MSSMVSAYTVDLTAIGKDFGRADAVACGAVLDRLDDQQLDQHETSLVELLRGPSPEAYETYHGYALEQWIASIGFRHPNDGWWSMRMEWFDGVSDALVAAGHPGLGGYPLPRRLPFDFFITGAQPIISVLPRHECADYLAALDRALAAPAWDEGAAASVRTLRRWAADAALWQHDLVAFYY